MKNVKTGFSLAEVLIAVAIAAIISTLGFTMARRGVEKAYDRYIYTGYIGISSAILDAIDGYGYHPNDCARYDTGTCKFKTHIYDLLSGRDLQTGEKYFSFKTPNKISYKIERIENNAGVKDYIITMTVPRAKSDGSSAQVCLTYLNNKPNYIIPAEKNICSITSTSAPDILNRIDLLPFYLQDGTVGTVDNSGNYIPRKFRSAKEAFCLAFNDFNSLKASSNPNDSSPQIKTVKDKVVMTCERGMTDNISDLKNYEKQENSSDEGVVIKVADPRRL